MLQGGSMGHLLEWLGYYFTWKLRQKRGTL